MPFADSINTASDEDGATNAECYTNKASTHFVCVASAAVRAGEEVLSHYGGALGDGQHRALSSSRYLVDYGFVPNPSLDGNGRVVLSAPELLLIDGTIIIGGSAGLRRALRRRRATTGESALEAANAIVAGIEEALASMSESEKEDMAELDGQAQAGGRRRWAAIVRVKERMTLKLVLAAARKEVAEKEGEGNDEL